MGIGSASEFEKWLANRVSRRAFYYALPSNFSAELVVVDLSAIIVGSFSSKRSLSADDMVERALWTARSLIASDPAPRIYESIDDRRSLSGCSDDVEGEPPVPDAKELKQQLEDGTDPAPRLTDTGTLVYTLDDPRFLPVIRKMEQEGRYADKKVCSQEELAEKGWRILASHPLPGNFPDPRERKPAPEQRAERSQALATPCVRRALRTYVPWAMYHSVVSSAVCMHCYGKAMPEKTEDLRRFDTHRSVQRSMQHAEDATRRGDDPSYRRHMDRARSLFMGEGNGGGGGGGTACSCDNRRGPSRTVVLDTVPHRFDVDTYGSTPLHEIPESFYRQAHSQVGLVEMDTCSGSVRWCETPAIGESDLKLVHYILEYSSEGDDVLVRNSDSDVLYILLLNAHRFTDPKTGAFTRRIFLDQGHARLALGRIHRRYICLNTLYKDIDDYGRQNWSLPKTGPVPHDLYAVTVLSSLVFLGNSDYTSGFRGIGPAKRIAVLENAGFMRKVTNMFKHIEVDGDHLAVAICLSLDFRVFVALECMVNAMTAEARSHLQKAGPDKRHHYSSVRDAIQMTSCKCKMPDMDTIVGTFSRISWALSYMANAPLACGVIPSPTALSHDGKPVWGWNMALKSHTVGRGSARQVAPVGWRSIASDAHTGPDRYVPVLDNCVTSPGPLVTGQVFVEVKARQKIGAPCYTAEIKPRWAFEVEIREASDF